MNIQKGIEFINERIIFNKVFFKNCLIDDNIKIVHKQCHEFVDSQIELYSVLEEINKYDSRKEEYPEYLIEQIINIQFKHNK